MPEIDPEKDTPVMVNWLALELKPAKLPGITGSSKVNVLLPDEYE